MAGQSSNPTSSYTQYLPAMLQADPVLGSFLLAFEQVLTGLEPMSAPVSIEAGDGAAPGLEAVLDKIHGYFDPDSTPEDFLSWLAGWVALSLRDDWSTAVKRRFLKQVVRLYKLRGTKAGLEAMLKIYLENAQETVQIYEFQAPAHYFQVQLHLASQDLVAYRHKEKIARAIIEQEKPAHTFYGLLIQMPTMRLVNAGDLLQVGVNTILGTTSQVASANAETAADEGTAANIEEAVLPVEPSPLIVGGNEISPTESSSLVGDESATLSTETSSLSEDENATLQSGSASLIGYEGTTFSTGSLPLTGESGTFSIESSPLIGNDSATFQPLPSPPVEGATLPTGLTSPSADEGATPSTESPSPSEDENESEETSP